MTIRKLSAILTLGAFSLVLAACNDKKADVNNKTEKESAPATQTASAEEGEAGDAASAVTIDGVSQFVNWDLAAMKVTKKGDGFVISDKEGPLELQLKPEGGGVYQETSPSHDMIGQGMRFVARKVGDVTTLTAYQGDMIVLTLLSCDDLIAYRNRGYRRMLTSKFNPTDAGQITITDDEMKGPILPDSPDLTYFFVEDGEGDLTDKIRTSFSRFHLAFAPADKGVNLHECRVMGETGDLEVSYGREYTIVLEYADDPGWEWLSTDVLDAEYLIYNFEKASWRLMLKKLKASKEPNEVERWNIQLLENLIEYNDPFTGLESTEA
jgi:hypothetical protein